MQKPKVNLVNYCTSSFNENQSETLGRTLHTSHGGNFANPLIKPHLIFLIENE
jgi:hypothetical protein